MQINKSCIKCASVASFGELYGHVYACMLTWAVRWLVGLPAGMGCALAGRPACWHGLCFGWQVAKRYVLERI